MKTSELRSKSVDQLKELLVNLQKEAFNLRFQRTTGELENVGRIKIVRRSIAKIKTLLGQLAKKETKNA